MAGRLVVEVGWRRCCLEACWECCSWLRLARWAVLFSEARWSQRVDLAGSHLSLFRPAPVAGYIATYRTCCKNTRTALLEMYVLTGPKHLDNWLDWTNLRRLLSCLEADPSVNTAGNNTWIVAIVGYHGKSCLSGCYLDTDLRKRYLVTEVHNMWEFSMGGPHTTNYVRVPYYDVKHQYGNDMSQWDYTRNWLRLRGCTGAVSPGLVKQMYRGSRSINQLVWRQDLV
jgi:hypothetical protein